MKTQFTNPFCEEFNQQKFYNLVSGQPVADIIADSLSKIDEVRQKCLEEFKTRMVSDKARVFFNPIAKNRRLTFATSEKKAKLKNAAKEEFRIQKDVLGRLLAEGNKTGTVINIDKALKYPFSPVCASLSTADGNKRKTKKSDLLSVLDDMEIDINNAHEKCKTYIVDLAAYIRSVIKQCKTVRDIADKLLASIPSRYDTVYVA